MDSSKTPSPNASAVGIYPLRHTFKETILEVLFAQYGTGSGLLLRSNDLLKFLIIKTRSANKTSKVRPAFRNHYALYVLIEDYIKGNFHNNGDYNTYLGAQAGQLIARQRRLPFGQKFGSQALNNALNQQFHKCVPTSPHQPVIRDAKTKRYWINEQLLTETILGRNINLAPAIIEIIDAYVDIYIDPQFPSY